MPHFVRNHTTRISLIILFLFFVFLSTPTSLAQQPETGVHWDQAIRIPSPEETSSWFPDLAVDSQGHVHVVWNETDHFGVLRDPDRGESVYYSTWDGQQWSPYNDIVPPQPDIIRNAIAVDRYDVLHFVFGWHKMYYKQAQANQALSAAAWTSPRLVNNRGQNYMKDIAVYEDTLHIAYDDTGAEDGECPGCADIYYRHSPDRGQTWSAPVSLFPTGTGSNYAQIQVDKKGVVYVAWNEGWDRLTGRGSPQYGVYMYSADGGSTWSAPAIVSYPNSTNMRLTVGSNGQGGVMLVWRTNSPEYPGIYYMWSTDYGASWAPPKTLPKIFAQPAATGHGSYDMATDSVGHIHLLVTGQLSRNQGLQGVYHFEWDGNNWSSPSPVYEGNWYPEYLHLVINRGNQLHATWHIAKDPYAPDVPLQVWYAHGQSQAPAETPVALPTFTPTPTPTPHTPTPTPIPTLTPTARPTLDPSLVQVSIPAGATATIYTDTDELMLLAKSLIPAILVVVVVVIGVRAWRRR